MVVWVRIIQFMMWSSGAFRKHSNEPSVYIQGYTFLDILHDCQLPGKDFTKCSKSAFGFHFFCCLNTNKKQLTSIVQLKCGDLEFRKLQSIVMHNRRARRNGRTFEVYRTCYVYIKHKFNNIHTQQYNPVCTHFTKQYTKCPSATQHY